MDNDIYSDASGRKDLQSLTGCKNPNVAKKIVAANLLGQFWLVKDLKKKNTAYKECLEKYKSNLEASKNSVAEAEFRVAEGHQKLADARQELEDSKNSQPSNTKSTITDESDEKKFLGMPRTTGIIVTSVGALILLGIGVIVYKKVTS